MAHVKITRVSPDPKVLYDSRKENQEGDDGEKYLVEFDGMLERPIAADGKGKAFILSEPPRREGADGVR